MTAYYNEIDPAAVHVLRHLIAEGIIAPGDVDTRSIREVRPDDIKGYTQCHFFAGDRLWSVAARLAGWPDERPLWTGSCPCQPHSGAASDRKQGFADERDLWPEWLRLIAKCRPDCIAGEQVDDSVTWIDRVFSDLEAENFAVGAVDLPACSVDAPVIGMRTYIVAASDCSGLREQGWAISVASAPQFDGSQRPSGRSLFSDHYTPGESGKVRRSEPRVRLLSDDVPGRVALLRIAGNAINPVLAGHILAALSDVLPEWRAMT